MSDYRVIEIDLSRSRNDPWAACFAVKADAGYSMTAFVHWLLDNSAAFSIYSISGAKEIVHAASVDELIRKFDEVRPGFYFYNLCCVDSGEALRIDWAQYSVASGVTGAVPEPPLSRPFWWPPPVHHSAPANNFGEENT